MYQGINEFGIASGILILPLVLIYFHFSLNPFIASNEVDDESEESLTESSSDEKNPVIPFNPISDIFSPIPRGFACLSLIIDLLVMTGIVSLIKVPDSLQPIMQSYSLVDLILVLHYLKCLIDVGTALLNRWFIDVPIDDNHEIVIYNSILRQDQYFALSLSTLTLIIVLTALGLFNISLYLVLIVIVDVFMIVTLILIEIYHNQSTSFGRNVWFVRIKNCITWAMVFSMGSLLHPFFAHQVINIYFPQLCVAWVKVRSI
jgi:hypothetical protein